ncbi:hypothetical protein QBC35DRAFT_81644 [Podospora australis]|uniref:Uncharacterized protein n=1 Tax=Podospora australis TaxID=1536484 RepID=A0AAN6WYC1_9PEZI|nr:hypothetical protein QBC35DRAFT_81644 [Podospora australis]
MLDENLPTFRLKPSSDNPLSTILYFTQSGSDPSAEYVLRRPDPALPASHNKYGIALCDPYNQDVIYGEVLVEPELSQPTLSAAEIRAQAQAGIVSTPATAIVPDIFTLQLYNPDQNVAMKMAAGSWGKSDTWEFEIPVQTFRTPTTSQIDREHQNNSPAEADLIPRIMFRWKRDGKLSKDMTCYMTGTNTAGRKSKEPDITIAMYKAAREGSVTMYQPNLHRVELEDRKGLEIILLLSAEVIKDLYLSPKPSMFNVQGGGPVSNKRKNSRPSNAVAGAATGAVAGAAMSGALNNGSPQLKPQQQSTPPPITAANNIAPPGPKPAVTFTSTPTANIEAETRRLQEMVEREKREREKAERAEQKRIKKMLEEEEKERRRREAEIAKETERLRKMYGVEGQDLPSDRPSLPPRPQNQAPPKMQTSPPPPAPQFPPPPEQPAHGPSWLGAPPPTLPPRPVSAGPYSGPPGAAQEQGPFHCGKLNVLWKGAAGQLQQIQHQVENKVSAYQLQQQQMHQQGGGGGPSRPGRRKSEEERKVQKKRSSHW